MDVPLATLYNADALMQWAATEKAVVQTVRPTCFVEGPTYLCHIRVGAMCARLHAAVVAVPQCTHAMLVVPRHGPQFDLMAETS